MVCIFCAFNTTGDKKNFGQISTFLFLFNKIEIGTKFLIQITLTAQKRQKTILDIMGYCFKNHKIG